MDELLRSIVLGAPNLGVALIALYFAGRLIERMVAAQEKLVEELLDLCRQNEELVKQASGAVTSKVTTDVKGV